MFGVAPDGTAYDLTGPQAGYDLTGPQAGADDAPVVVLIHGLGLCRALWADHVAAFAGYRVLVYDLYGHGQSAPASRPITLRVYADQLADLMDHLGIARAHIVGFSIGGMINRRFALDHGPKVASLVILNSPHYRGDEAQKMVEERAASVREQGAFSTFDAALRRWFTPAFLDAGAGQPGHGAARVRDWRGLVDAESYAQAAWVLAHGVRELIAPVPAVRARTLVMTCENDSGSTPKMSHDIAAEIVDAKTIIIKELQHLGLMEAPEVFTSEILDFLSEGHR